MDEVFRALADASRRRLLDSQNARNGQSLRERTIHDAPPADSSKVNG